ncbi:hypothetical protein ACHAWF_016797, partial [Thalassiosira exigua]
KGPRRCSRKGGRGPQVYPGRAREAPGRGATRSSRPFSIMCAPQPQDEALRWAVDDHWSGRGSKNWKAISRRLPRRTAPKGDTAGRRPSSP